MQTIVRCFLSCKLTGCKGAERDKGEEGRDSIPRIRQGGKCRADQSGDGGEEGRGQDRTGGERRGGEGRGEERRGGEVRKERRGGGGRRRG
eukprot:767770-Hanusia_phi.AAC.2